MWSHFSLTLAFRLGLGQLFAGLSDRYDKPRLLVDVHKKDMYLNSTKKNNIPQVTHFRFAKTYQGNTFNDNM